MLRVLADLLPLALAGLFTPAWIVMTIAMLSTNRPLKNAVLFVAGIGAARLATGGIALFLFEIPAFAFGIGSAPGPFASGVSAGLAAVAFLLAAREFRLHAEPVGRLEQWKERFDRLAPVAAFGLGALVHAIPGAQYVFLLGGVDVIARAGLDPARSLVLLVALTAIQHAMLAALPVAYVVLGRDRSRQVLLDVSAWLTRHGHAVNGVVLLLVGAYLVFLALPYLDAVLDLPILTS